MSIERARGRVGLVVALVLGMLLVRLTPDAQQAGKVARIGFLGGGSDTSANVGAFRQGLRELGWVEGQNIVIDYRFADGRHEVRAGHQPQDRQGPRPDDPAIAAAAGGEVTQ
jgi:hypothetical protein